MFTLSDRGARPGGRAILGTILLSLWLLLLAVPASAHDTLTGSDPAAGEVLTEAPSALELTYSGDISELGVQFMVTGPEGRDVVQGTATVEGTVVTQELVEELMDGDYEVAWRVTSSDGHPISGSYVFTIEAATDDEDPETGSATTVPQDPAEEPTSADTGGTGSDAADPTTSAAPSPTPGGAGETTSDAAATTTTESSNGIPAWGWLVAALAAAGLVACGFLAFRRH